MSRNNQESEPLLDVERNNSLDSHPDNPLGRPHDQSFTNPRSSLEMSTDSDSSGSQNKYAARMARWVPAPARKAACWVRDWSVGPEQARPHRIKPLLPEVQELPIRLLHRFLPRRCHRALLYVAYLAVWFVTFTLMFRKSTYATEIDGWGVPVNIGCGEAYWVRNNMCGLDGNLCRPFNGSGLAFRCPASCASYEVKNPRAVGDQEILYAPVIVGGPANDSDPRPIYRGDSFVCAAALHSGIIANAKGGCGVVELIGESTNYVGSRRNDMESVSFDSYFPLSFSFASDVQCDARDLRWEMLAVDLTFVVVLSIFLSSPHVFFFTVMPAVFWHVGMASDPPPHATVASLIEVLTGRFLPAMFVAWVMFDRMGIKRSLTGLTAHFEKTVLWLGACWTGALENYTFDKIPINRLTPHDLAQQPGAKAALALVIIVAVFLVAAQVWFLRQEGRLVKYFRFYVLIGLVLLVFFLVPQLNVRLHHYVLALLLLPGTSMQTRLSLLIQGLLVGLFINGVARWGFDSMLQTSVSLQGDAVHNSPLPVILPPNVTLADDVWTIAFEWMPPPGPRYDGLSILVNDVERHRTYFDEEQELTFEWDREPDLDLPEYFRFGYMEGTTTWDYTKAGKWSEDGEWVDMAPGPSRSKRELKPDGDVYGAIRSRK